MPGVPEGRAVTPESEADGRRAVDASRATNQLTREIANLKETITTRLDGMDKATESFKSDLVRVPTELDKQIAQLKELIWARIQTIEAQFSSHATAIDAALKAADGSHAERGKTLDVRFASVQTQFAERDVRVKQEAQAATTAVAAALQAQKEAAGEQNKSLITAIDKQERSTANQLEQQRIVLGSIEKSINDKITELGSRMTRAEGTGIGRSQITAPLVVIICTVVAGLVLAAAVALKPGNAADVSAAARIAVLEQSQREHEVEDQRRAAAAKP